MTDIELEFDYTENTNRMRILLIIYYFSKPYEKEGFPKRISVCEDEMKIQKIHFFMRYPSYLCHAFIKLVEEGKADSTEIKAIIRKIFNDQEPEIRTDDMERFQRGAYEKLDNIISYWKSIEYIEHTGDRARDGKIYNNKYYLTKLGKEQIEKGINDIECIKWYSERCKLIHKYFGHLSATQLKDIQYGIAKYENTPIGQNIPDIQEEIYPYFQSQFNEQL